MGELTDEEIFYQDRMTALARRYLKLKGYKRENALYGYATLHGQTKAFELKKFIETEQEKEMARDEK